MHHLTETEQLILRRIMPHSTQTQAPNVHVMGFVVDVVQEPIATKEVIEDVIARGMSGHRPRSEWLRQQRTPSDVQSTVEGGHTYRGRACCFHHLRSVEMQLAHRHDLPFDTTCATCQTVYRIRRGITTR